MLQLRRTHPTINRYNTALAVGLRHNHDVSFIGTSSKSLALIYYLTNYTTKVEDPSWKRAAIAAELYSENVNAKTSENDKGKQPNTPNAALINRFRQYILSIANRLFTQQPLSHVEVLAYLLHYPSEFSSTSQWAHINMTLSYWSIFRRWPHLRYLSGEMDLDDSDLSTDNHAVGSINNTNTSCTDNNAMEDDISEEETVEIEEIHEEGSHRVEGNQASDGQLGSTRQERDEPIEGRVLIGEGGKKLSVFEAYHHRGEVLKLLCLYDYLSLIQIQRKVHARSKKLVRIELDQDWSASEEWVQILRQPGNYAVPCINGFLNMDFEAAEQGNYYQQAAVQHLALFVPWQLFTSEASQPSDLWKEWKDRIPKRLQTIAGNIQLLRRSAEDARRDAEQWAAAGDDALLDDLDAHEADTGAVEPHQANQVGTFGRLVETIEAALGPGQITEGSEQLTKMHQQLRDVQQEISEFEEDLGSLITAEPIRQYQPSLLPQIPEQSKLASIKSQQDKESRKIEMRILGDSTAEYSSNAGQETGLSINNAATGFGGDPMEITEPDAQHAQQTTITVQYAPETTFKQIGESIADEKTLNKRQRIAFLLLCHHLDQVEQANDEGQSDEISARVPQFCQFLGGEGGTGKSRVIEALAEVFSRKSISHRLLITAPSGAAAAHINGVTLHTACRIKIKDSFATESTKTYIDAVKRTNWKEKWLLIVDEVSMLGAHTLHAADKQMRRFRGTDQDFGGIPVILFSGDFSQFRPVKDRSILTLDSNVTSEELRSARHLWRKFTNVILLDEQMRAAGDPRLQRLLQQIRRGEQDETDMELLNNECFHEGQAIPWGTGITAVTPLNSNRWNLNMEATLDQQEREGKVARLFLPQHTWAGGKKAAVSEREARLVAGLGDDSSCPIPAMFIFVPGMRVVVNKNRNLGLKIVNGAMYEAQEVIIDKMYPGYQISPSLIVHFGPPAGLLIKSDSTKDYCFRHMPPGTLLLTPESSMIHPNKTSRSWQRHPVSRKGLACTAAFACTDYKVQGRTLEQVAVELRGAKTGSDGEPLKCDWHSLYVQLSRCKSLDGITLISKIRTNDIVKNKQDDKMVLAERQLVSLCEITIQKAQTLL